MNEKTTQSDMDLKIRKIEFLENFLAFAEQAKERVVERFLHKNINHEKLIFFENGMQINLYKDGKYVSLRWGIEYGASGIEVHMYECGDIKAQYETNPDILKKFLDIPFEEFTNAFEKLFAKLKGEPKKISISVTQEQLDKINEHGII